MRFEKDLDQDALIKFNDIKNFVVEYGEELLGISKIEGISYNRLQQALVFDSKFIFVKEEVFTADDGKVYTGRFIDYLDCTKDDLVELYKRVESIKETFIF